MGRLFGLRRARVLNAAVEMGRRWKRAGAIPWAGLEEMERRQLLSGVSAQVLAHPFKAGVTFNYEITDDENSDTATEVLKVGGTVNIPTGAWAGTSATEFDITFSTETGDEALGKSYVGFDANGNYVDYEDITPGADGTDGSEDDYSPPEVAFPAELQAGVLVTASTVDSDPTDPDNTPVNETFTYTLESDEPELTTVRAGAFNAYVIDETEVDDPQDDPDGSEASTSNVVLYDAPGVGIVAIESTDDGITVDTELVSATGIDTLEFEPIQNTAVGKLIEGFDVKVVDSDGNVDTNNNEAITVGLVSDEGTLDGTTTVNADRGEALFDDLSIDKAGTYTLVAAAANTIGGTSDPFEIVGDHLAFTTEPSSSNLNTAIPVIVEFENPQGQIDTTVSGQVQLTLNTVGGGEDAELGGTSTLNIVSGVASFTGQNAPTVNAGGKYTLTATELDDSNEPVDSTTPATSNPFIATDDHFVFQPAPGNSAEPDAPIEFLVAVDGKDGQVDTAYTGIAKVTLNVIKSQGQASFGGTTQVAFVDGAADFSGSSAPTIDTAGAYSLTVIPEDDQGQPEPWAALPVTSGQIVIGGDKIVFNEEPGNAEPGADIPFTVELQNAQKKVDTNADGKLKITFRATAGGANASLSGTTTVNLVDGVAQFPSAESDSDDSGLKINAVGTYIFTATELVLDDDTDQYVPSTSSNPADSAPFTVQGDHLVFTQQPGNAGTDEPIAMTVEVEDSKNKVDPTASGSVDLALNVVKGGSGAELAGTTRVTLVDGVATFSSDQAPTINAAGTFTLTATQLDDHFAPVDSTQTATSKSFVAAEDHLVFTKAPAATQDLDSPIEFTVSVENAQHKVDENFTDDVQVSLNTLKSSGTPTLGGNTLLLFTNGVAEFTGENAPTIDTPGTYTITVTPVTQDPDTHEFASTDDATPATSGQIKVAGDHLVFLSQPSDADVGSDIPMKVALEDSANKVDTSATSEVKVTLNTISGGSNAQLTGTTTILFLNGIAEFPSDTGEEGDDGLKINAQGTYTFTATELVQDPQTLEFAPSTTSDPVDSSSFKISGDHLVFKTQPANTDADDPLLFTVQLLDSANKPVTDTTTDEIQIDFNAVQGGQSAQLNGTAIVPIIDGAASFTADAGALSIDEPGTYTLTATEVDPTDDPENPSPVTTTLAGTSKSFKITGDHLVFTKQPADTPLGDPLTFNVTLEDSKNKVVTDQDADEVQLTLNAVSGGENAEIQGTDTVHFVNGVAAFSPSANGLSINGLGTFTLSAAELGPDEDNDFVPVDTTEGGTSGTFKIVGDHIVFVTQPANADTNTPIPFKIESMTPQNKVDTNDNSSMQISLNTITGGQDAELSGDVTLSFVSGVATFAAPDAPAIDIPGTYTFTATELDADSSPSADSDPGTSKEFKVTGNHLVFTQQPADGTVDEPIQFTVTAEDSKNKVDTKINSDQAEISFTAVSGGANASLSGETAVQFTAGVATFGLAQDVEFDGPGTFTLTATEVSSEDGQPANDSEAGTSKSFKINGDHLAFKTQPAGGDVGAPITFIVVAENAKNQVDTSANVDHAQITLSTVSGGNNATLNGTTDVQFVNGVANFTGDDAPQLSAPGTYTLTATEFAPDEDQGGDLTPLLSSEPATSKSFTISGYHLVFNPKPANGTTDDPLPFTVAVEDSKNKVVSDVNVEVDITFTAVSGGENATLSGTTQEDTTGGMADFASPDAPQLDTPGTYTFTATAANNPDTGDDVDAADITAATSKSFKVAGDHLVFTAEPASVNAEAPLVFTVSVENAQNKVDTEVNSDAVDISLNKVKGGTGAELGGTATVDFAGGVAVFDASKELSIDAPGTYTLTAGEVDGENMPVQSTQPGISKSFTVSGYHLVFNSQPGSVAAADDPVTFTVVVEDAKNKLVLDAGAQSVLISLNIVKPGSGAELVGSATAEFVNGVATFSAGSGLSVDTSGSYTLTATAIGPDPDTQETGPLPNIDDATSRTFLVH